MLDDRPLQLELCCAEINIDGRSYSIDNEFGYWECITSFSSTLFLIATTQKIPK